MKTFLNEDILLKTKTARRLYHGAAAELLFTDYHDHLPAGKMADDINSGNLAYIWLNADHYKWEAMRVRLKNISVFYKIK